MGAFRTCVCLAIIATFVPDSYGWTCKLESDWFGYFNDWCLVPNLTDPDQFRSDPINQSANVSKLMLEASQSAFVEPWMEEQFPLLDHMFIAHANTTMLYILPKLQQLYLRKSQVDKIKLHDEKPYQLKELYLSNTTITLPKDMHKLNQLDYFVIVFANLSSFDLTALDGLVNLKTIVISYTNMAELTIPADINLPGLKSLEMAVGQLKAIPQNINRLSGLEKIILSAQKISHVEMTAFNGLQNLRHLDLEANSIVEISCVETAILPGLERFFLTDNKLEELDMQNWQTPELKILDLTQNSDLSEIANINATHRRRWPLALDSSVNQLSCRFVEQNAWHVIFQQFTISSEKCNKRLHGICCHAEK